MSSLLGEKSPPHTLRESKSYDTREDHSQALPAVSDMQHITPGIVAPSEPPEAEPEWKAGRQEWLMLLTLSFLCLMVALDASILVPALPTISKALNGNANETFWAGTSYLLVSSVTIPFLSALSDIFGRRAVLVASLLFFTAGSVVCGLADNFTVLLIGRVLQGVGGGGIVPLSLIVQTDIIPLRQRPKYAAIVQFAWAVGTISGPIVGGALAEHATWRWIFYLNFPFCGVGLVVVPLVVRLQKAQQESFGQKLLKVDWLGGLVFVGGTTSFLIAITWGGVQYDWASAPTLVPLTVGLAAIVAAMAWEAWGAKQPFIRLSVFKNRSGVLAFICSVFQGLLLFAQLYYISLYFLSVQAFSPTRSGLALLPISLAFVPSGIIVSVLISKTGHVRWALWSGWVIMTTACGLLLLLDSPTVPTGEWIGIFVVVGVGQGFLVQALTFVAQVAVGERTADVAYAAAMYAFARTLGMTLGVALGGAVFQNMLQHHLADGGFAGDVAAGIAKNAEAFIERLVEMPPSHGKDVIVMAYADGVRNVFMVLLGISALGGFLSLFVRRATFDRALDSEHAIVRAA